MSCRGTVTAAPSDFQVRPLWGFVSRKAAAKMCVTFVLVRIGSRKDGSLNVLIHLLFSVWAVLLLSVLHAASRLWSLLSFHRCFTSTHLQEGELSAILQDIAKSRQNIQQSLSGVSTVLPLTPPAPLPHPPPVAAALWTLMFRCLPWNMGEEVAQVRSYRQHFCPAPRLLFCMWACMLRFLAS